jgi:hypothetical protein
LPTASLPARSAGLPAAFAAFLPTRRVGRPYCCVKGRR